MMEFNIVDLKKFGGSTSEASAIGNEVYAVGTSDIAVLPGSWRWW